MSSQSTPGSPGSTTGSKSSTYREAGNGVTGRSDFDLKHMREDVSRLAGVVAHVAERRVARTRQSAEIAMRDAPWATVSIAAAAGFLLALAVVPSRSRRASRQHLSRSWQDRLPDFDARELGRHVHVPRAPHVDTERISSRFEDLMESLSRIDSNKVTPALEKLKEWYASARSAADRALHRKG